MLNHFETLCSLCGTSGDESEVRSYLISVLEHTDRVSWWIDPLGNLLVEKRGKARAPHKLMISAHMDEVGLIVTNVHADGTLLFAPVGGVDASVILGRQVLVGPQKLQGVVGAKPIHMLSKEEKTSLPKCGALSIDIGAENQKEAKALVAPGTYAYFAPDYQPVGEHRICSKAIDDRFGCALLLWMLEQESAYDFTAAFLVQEEIGLRGAKAVAYTVAPDFALVLEATTAADLDGAEEDAKVCTLGGGPVVSFMDRSTIYDREMYALAFSLCEKQGIPCQTKSRIAGGNDSGAIHVSRGGVRTLAVSLPCRYLHSPSCLADFRDMESCQKLVKLLAEELMHMGE